MNFGGGDEPLLIHKSRAVSCSSMNISRSASFFVFRLKYDSIEAGIACDNRSKLPPTRSAFEIV